MGWMTGHWPCLHFLPAITLFSLIAAPEQSASFSLFEDTVQKWRQYRNECIENVLSQPDSLTGDFCHRFFDMHICWPDALPGTKVNVSCPWYIPWIDRVDKGSAFRYCTEKGSWLMDNYTNEPWVDHSECDEDHVFLHQQLVKQQTLSTFRFVYTAGYTLSLITLIGASLTLISFRKLHCMRNYIHLNLFGSFILRAIAVLVKDVLMDNPQAGNGNVSVELQTADPDMVTMWCRSSQIFLHYSVLCTYHWLLVEGLFLYFLLIVSVFTEQKCFLVYLLIGWGVPLIFVFPWIIVKFLQENSGCWRQNTNMSFWWIVRSPMLLVIIINFAIFIRIIILLVSKMRSHQTHNTDFKNRLTKSTLILIPLLGVHEIFFIFITDENAKGILRYIKLFVELLFGSIQVQNELKKKLQLWKMKRNLRKSHHRHCSDQRENFDSTGQYIEMGTRDDLESPNTDEALLNTLSSNQGLNSEITELPRQASEILLNVTAV
ncbi:glucagon-like peptide 1 receptor isoform X2 [Stegostoma tigrinum]|uniref:glucagon-like peptide 1 receptor isoform X2 n=1 Tax=Stegostoma tigrinum TaxID=3053191 RepID=UPI00202B1F30|nr:glucagon-like peptide 1 receptor isoform X2 [Stegostoma tigrinum]